MKRKAVKAMKNLILGDLGGYMANRAMDNEEFRLDTPEPELGATKSQSPASSGLAGLGRWAQESYHNLFNAGTKKTAEEGKARP